MSSEHAKPSTAAAAERARIVDYAASLDCIHCGLCLQTCPTFRLTGVESSSPRGRIHLMRAVAEGRAEPDTAFVDEMDFCLLCRHCESVCPAGVHFGPMMEHTRGALEERRWGLLRRLARWGGFRVLLPHRLLLRLAGSLLRAAQILGLDRLADRVGGDRGLAHLPRIPPLSSRRLLPETTAAVPDGTKTGARRTGEAQAELLLLEGCVVPEFHSGVNRATVRVLARLGFPVRVPRGLTCCGSLHAHNGDRDGARALARTAIGACEPELDSQGRARLLVVNSAGCGAHLKELAQLFEPSDPWRERAESLARRVRDFSQVVAPALEGSTLAQAPPDVQQPVAWDDPCHLCHAQGLRAEPRTALAAIAGLQLVELPDSEACCGSAGIYSLLRPESSRAIFAKKEADLASSGARTLVTANPGCQLQWESGLARAGSPVRVLHLAELLDSALCTTEQQAKRSGEAERLYQD